ncbi:hypothetical protein QVD17_08817 [Tagetes erecta]|uniref:Retrovirus-related Pol polyprotein from transposon TNT 1-94-like beta-barrel domain-containing protein n=1 Tax=Tagetes erecta TaxID=13708 RepID=A0AAD8L2S7_TARER|nr:hypothetical protein QVD17_08817 [Tagetes erecta]
MVMLAYRSQKQMKSNRNFSKPSLNKKMGFDKTKSAFGAEIEKEFGLMALNFDDDKDKEPETYEANISKFDASKFDATKYISMPEDVKEKVCTKACMHELDKEVYIEHDQQKIKEGHPVKITSYEPKPKQVYLKTKNFNGFVKFENSPNKQSNFVEEVKEKFDLRNKGEIKMIYNDDKGEVSEGFGFDNPHFKRYLNQKESMKAENKFKTNYDLKTGQDPETSAALELKKKTKKKQKKKTKSNLNSSNVFDGNKVDSAGQDECYYKERTKVHKKEQSKKSTSFDNVEDFYDSWTPRNMRLNGSNQLPNKHFSKSNMQMISRIPSHPHSKESVKRNLIKQFLNESVNDETIQSHHVSNQLKSTYDSAKPLSKPFAHPPRAKNSLWIVDSGCSRHMTGNQELLDQYQTKKGSYVAFGDGGGWITSEGTVRNVSLSFDHCKKQTNVSVSTAEAEYIAASACCSQVLWCQKQLLDYGFNFLKTPIYIDNTAAIFIISNPVQHSKTKHIQIRYHFLRDNSEKGLIVLVQISTENQLADLFTKAFDQGRFEHLVQAIVIPTHIRPEVSHEFSFVVVIYRPGTPQDVQKIPKRNDSVKRFPKWNSVNSKNWKVKKIPKGNPPIIYNPKLHGLHYTVARRSRCANTFVHRSVDIVIRRSTEITMSKEESN